MTNLSFPEHTKEKLDELGYYYDVWFNIVRKQKTYLIDCNAGTGYCEIDVSKEKILGFWIGKLNYIKASNIKSNEKKNYTRIRRINSNKNLKRIIRKSVNYDNTIIKIKDSIYNYLSL